MEDKDKQDLVEKITLGQPPANLISIAIQGGNVELDKLKGLLELQERWEANQAKKAFASSFSNAQSEIGAVVRTKLNTQTHSKYAVLEDVINTAKPIYSKYGFSVIFYESDTSLAEHIRICADVLHVSGHKETYHYDVPLDGVGFKGNANMTKIHGKASSTSYARRYLMCMIWNIPTEDDNDAQNVGVEFIDDKQINEIRDLLIDAEATEVGFLTYMKIKTIEEMPKKEYTKAKVAIEGFKKALLAKKAGKK